MENWRRVWRDGVLPQLTIRQLSVLLEALKSDDPTLLQGATTSPTPLVCTQEWPVEGACLLGYLGWKGADLDLVGEVAEFFARLCCECDMALVEPAGCRWLINWYDNVPRERMRLEFIREIEGNLGALIHQYGEEVA